MTTLSVIVPSRNEQFLAPTVQGLLDNARGEVEVIVVLEGYWPDPPLVEDKRLVILHNGRAHGLRAAVNAAAGIARGDYIMKADAHCLFAEGYDLALAEDCDGDWIVIPRRYALDAENWCRKRTHPPVDYLYIECPAVSAGGDLAGKVWDQKNRDPELEKILINDLMTFQGSSYFMRRDYYHRLGGMDENLYGTFRKEPQELGFKCWCSGGRVVRNKKTWYAHLHKGKQYGRGYAYSQKDYDKGDEYNKRWLTDSAWEGQTIPFRRFVEKFMPIPGWEGWEW